LWTCRAVGSISSSIFCAGEHRVKAFVLGVIVGIIAVPLCDYFYFASGAAPAAASDPPMPFET